MNNKSVDRHEFVAPPPEALDQSVCWDCGRPRNIHQVPPVDVAAVPERCLNITDRDRKLAAQACKAYRSTRKDPIPVIATLFARVRADLVAAQPSQETIETLPDDVLTARAEFHSFEAGRLRNELAKVWRHRVRIGIPTEEDKALAANLNRKQQGEDAGLSHSQIVVEKVSSEKADQWQPIDTAPKTNTEILTTNYRSGGTYYVSLSRWYEREGKHGWWGRNGLPDYPTHWMPLPDPPRVRD